ncbi:hypothetical protein M885DRAFT_504606 [Pelagophyceae sp. CCMP2097]|nr:hypothetical protein M885DRAFT_504606 [Pelagophyceae sp. CCMP2097]
MRLLWLVLLPAVRPLVLGSVNIDWRTVDWRSATAHGASWEARVPATVAALQQGLGPQSFEIARELKDRFRLREAVVLVTCGRALALIAADDAESLDAALAGVRRDLAQRCTSLALAPSIRLQLAPPDYAERATREPGSGPAAPEPQTAEAVASEAAVSEAVAAAAAEAAAAEAAAAAATEATTEAPQAAGVDAVDLSASQLAALGKRQERKAARAAAALFDVRAAEASTLRAFEDAAVRFSGTACEAHCLRFGAGLESAIIGDHAVTRQLRKCADANSAEAPRISEVLRAALLTGRAARDGRLGESDLARFAALSPKRTQSWRLGVLRKAEAVVLLQHAALSARRRAKSAGPAISALRRTAIKKADGMPEDLRFEAHRAVQHLLHAPTVALRGSGSDQIDGIDRIAADALEAVDTELLRLRGSNGVAAAPLRRPKRIAATR